MEKIGSILRYERENKNISREKLCCGLCTAQMLNKIEDNKCETDKLLMDILFQRLGKSPDKLELIISEEEYKKICERDDIDMLICKNRLNKAEQKLETYMAQFEKKMYAHQMYYYRTKAYILLQQGKYIQAYELIENAVELTIPKWKSKQMTEYYISTYEMENLLVYGVTLYKMEREAEALEHIDKCLKYITTHFGDREEYAKIYPKCVCVLAKLCLSKEYDERVVGLCEEGMALLRKESISYLMIPLMEELIYRYERNSEKEMAVRWEKYVEVLKDVYKELEVDMDLGYLYFRPAQCEIHLDYETVRGERRAKDITQEKLIEGVYSSAETLSRVENRRTSPTKNKFEGLMQNLDMDKTRYNTFMVSTSFEVLEMKNELDDYLEGYEIESAYKKLTEIEQKLDMTIADNRRFVDNIKNSLERIQGKITPEEALEKAVKLLRETYDYEKECNRPPMRNEAILIAQVDAILEQMGRLEEASNIVERVLKICDRSKVQASHRFRSYIMLCTHYERRLEDKCDIDTIPYTRKLLKLELSVGKGSGIGDGMMIIASYYVDTDVDEEKCKEALKKSYHLYNLFMQRFYANEIAEFYKNKYNEEIY